VSKRVSNKAHGGGARTRPGLGYWRLRKAQLRAERAGKERDAMRIANQMATAAKAKPKGVLHYLTSAVKKLRNQGRQRHTGGQHG